MQHQSVRIYTLILEPNIISQKCIWVSLFRADVQLRRVRIFHDIHLCEQHVKQSSDVNHNVVKDMRYP